MHHEVQTQIQTLPNFEHFRKAKIFQGLSAVSNFVVQMLA